jgi:hypothetical protein
MGVKFDLLRQGKNPDWKCVNAKWRGEYVDLRERGSKRRMGGKSHTEKFHNLEVISA